MRPGTSLVLFSATGCSGSRLREVAAVAVYRIYVYEKEKVTSHKPREVVVSRDSWTRGEPKKHRSVRAEKWK